MSKLSDEINNLPKPYTMEEQYLYSLVCDIAGVAPKAGYLSDNVTFKSPFWRMQQYWHAFCQATEQRMGLPVVPSSDTVSKNSLTEEVSNSLLGNNRVATSMLQDGSVTEDKLAPSVAARLLNDRSIVLEMLALDIISRLLPENGLVDDTMISPEIEERLLGNNRVTYDMMSPEIQAKLNKIV